jgi:hypothetical protein
MVDTSGSYAPPAIQATIQQTLGGGVYTDTNLDDAAGNVVSGRVSLGFIGALVVLAVGFYLWTHTIQGGG